VGLSEAPGRSCSDGLLTEMSTDSRRFGTCCQNLNAWPKGVMIDVRIRRGSASQPGSGWCVGGGGQETGVARRNGSRYGRQRLKTQSGARRSDSPSITARGVEVARRLWEVRRARWLPVAAGLVVPALLVWALWPTPKQTEQPRARQYLDFTACLLTDADGVTGAQAAPVWAGMQDASQATHAKVQYLSVSGPQTVENAMPFLNSLAQGHCDLVVAVGDAPVAAVRAGAGKFPAAVSSSSARGLRPAAPMCPLWMPSRLRRSVTR
jgi:hypothetical protein